MPIYEYRCEKCEHEFEREQRITDDPVKTCPECRSRKVKKLISQTSFVLKGGGWYNDLYSSTKKDSDSKKGSDEKGESSGTKGESSGTKGESSGEKGSEKKSSDDKSKKQDSKNSSDSTAQSNKKKSKSAA